MRAAAVNAYKLSLQQQLQQQECCSCTAVMMFKYFQFNIFGSYLPIVTVLGSN